MTDEPVERRRDSDRLIKLETKMESNAAYIETEISSLRASRHAHGELLQKHELQIAALQITATEVPSLREAVSALNTCIAELRSDARVDRWKIGLILGVLYFALTKLSAYLHF